MPSFDIVSETDLSEVDNAVANVLREIETRFDFKGSNSTLEHKDGVITIHADDDLKLKQMHELLQGHLTKRKIDVGMLDYQTAEKAAGQSVRQIANVKQGIEKELAKTIVKMVKASKIKVQVSIQGAELRVSGKKRDDLQAVMQLLRGENLDQPVQFKNMRD
ncbi:MAG: YajQ family cyclic di-GMP-binding protein [Pseudomonadota bacterium]